MLQLFKRFFKQNPPGRKVATGDTPYHVKSADELISNFTTEVQTIKELSQAPDKHFDLMYLDPLKKVLQYVQMVPASENHHHARPGGMLEHILEIVEYALKLRRGKILPPGVAPEEIELRKDAWTYTVFIGALLHDIGKVITDTQFNDGREAWYPLLDSQPPENYNYTYKATRKHKFHEHLPLMVLYRFVDMKHIQWLQKKDLEAFEALVYFLAGNYEKAGELGDIVQKADQYSVINDIGGKVDVATANRKLPFAENFMRYLKKLLQDTQKLQSNRSGAAVFTNEKLAFFVVKRMLDEVKEAMRSEGQSIPSDNHRIMDELQQFDVLVSNDDKAVWKIHIQIGSWETDLSTLAFPIEKIWPRLSDRPQIPDDMTIQLPGTVEVESNSGSVKDEPKDDSVPTEADSENPVNQDADMSPPPGIKADSELENDGELSINDLMAEVETEVFEDQSEFDLSEFNDELVEDEQVVPEAVDESLSEKTEVTNLIESETVPERLSSSEDFVKDTVEKIRAGQKSSVDAHNKMVYEEAQALVEFDDPDSQGALFIKWLVTGIKSGSIPVNQNYGRVHLVDEGLFLASPGIFRDFESNVPGGIWSKAQRELTRKRINLKTPNKGENIFKYTIKHAENRNNGGVISGYLIPNPETKLGLVITEKNEGLIKNTN